MSKEYNIISKHPKGNIVGAKYKIEYQIDNQPERYTTEMIYFKSSKMFQGKDCCYVFYSVAEGVKTNDDRTRFVDELNKFQKGGSYRKSHPIIYTELERLERERDKLSAKINVIKWEKAVAMRKEFMNCIDKEEVDDFFNRLLAFTDNETFTIKTCSLTYVQTCIYDKILKIPVAVIDFRGGRFIIRDLYDEEIDRIDLPKEDM